MNMAQINSYILIEIPDMTPKDIGLFADVCRSIGIKVHAGQLEISSDNQTERNKSEPNVGGSSDPF